MGEVTKVSNGVLELGLVIFILATLGAGLSNANFSSFVEIVIGAINDNISNVGIAILGIVLGWGLPKLMALAKSKK